MGSGHCPGSSAGAELARVGLAGLTGLKARRWWDGQVRVLRDRLRRPRGRAAQWRHDLSDFPHSVKLLVECDDLSDERKRKILTDNPAKLFGIPVP